MQQFNLHRLNMTNSLITSWIGLLFIRGTNKRRETTWLGAKEPRENPRMYSKIMQTPHRQDPAQSHTWNFLDMRQQWKAPHHHEAPFFLTMQLIVYRTWKIGWSHQWLYPLVCGLPCQGIKFDIWTATFLSLFWLFEHYTWGLSVEPDWEQPKLNVLFVVTCWWIVLRPPKHTLIYWLVNW